MCTHVLRAHTHTHTGKLDRVWIIVTLVQSVQSVRARGSKTHLVFLLYRPSPLCNGLFYSVKCFLWGRSGRGGSLSQEIRG